MVLPMAVADSLFTNEVEFLARSRREAPAQYKVKRDEQGNEAVAMAFSETLGFRQTLSPTLGCTLVSFRIYPALQTRVQTVYRVSNTKPGYLEPGYYQCWSNFIFIFYFLKNKIKIPSGYL